MIAAHSIGYLAGVIEQHRDRVRLGDYTESAKRDIAFYARLESEGLLDCYNESARGRILAFIAEYTNMHGLRPSPRVVAQAIGVSRSYVSTVMREPRL